MSRILWIVAVLFIIPLFLSTSYSAEWNFYGSARLQTFIEDEDYGDLALTDQKNYSHTLQTNSRIGAKVIVNEQLTARFEYGTGVNLRILYGEWDFGPGSLLVGQTYSPLNMLYANQVWWDDTNLLDFGGLYSGRNPMVRLKLGNFQLAMVSPASPSISGLSVTEVKLPKFEAKYRFAGEKWHFEIAGGYNAYEILNNGQTYDIDSYIIALGGGVSFGSAYLKASAWKGRNTGSYRLINQPMDSPTIDFNTQTVNDNDASAFILVAGYKINEAISLEAGCGYTQAELDMVNSHKDAIASYYLQSKLTLAPGVFVVPEVGLIDWKTNALGVDQGETVYYGAKWQIDF